jgi:hypothetical protein
MTIDQLQFEALRNAIYNASRKQWLNKVNRLLSFLIVASGATAIADLGSRVFGYENGTVIAAALATLAATLQLVFDFGGRAAQHDYLQRRYYELLSTIVKEGANAEASPLEAKLISIYADEPAPLRALDAIARNAAVEALGCDQSQRVRVTFWQTLWSQICPFNDAEFPYVTTPAKQAAS